MRFKSQSLGSCECFFFRNPWFSTASSTAEKCQSDSVDVYKCDGGFWGPAAGLRKCLFGMDWDGLGNGSISENGFWAEKQPMGFMGFMFSNYTTWCSLPRLQEIPSHGWPRLLSEEEVSFLWVFVFSWKAGKLAQLVSGRYLDFDSFFFRFWMFCWEGWWMNN